MTVLCFFTFYTSCTLPSFALFSHQTNHRTQSLYTTTSWSMHLSVVHREGEKNHMEFQIKANCEHFVTGLAGIRYRTLFQKCEFHEAAPRECSLHLMGALFRIRCCKPGGRCLYPSGPVSPIWIRMTLISCWTSTWWSPTWKCGSTSLLNRNRS